MRVLKRLKETILGKKDLYKITKDGKWKLIDKKGREIDKDGYIKIKSD